MWSVLFADSAVLRSQRGRMSFNGVEELLKQHYPALDAEIFQYICGETLVSP